MSDINLLKNSLIKIQDDVKDEIERVSGTITMTKYIRFIASLNHNDRKLLSKLLVQNQNTPEKMIEIMKRLCLDPDFLENALKKRII